MKGSKEFENNSWDTADIQNCLDAYRQVAALRNPFVSLCEHSKMHFRHGHVRYVACRKSEFAAFWARLEVS